MGKLSQTDYDLRLIRFEPVGAIRRLRLSIAAKGCACRTANVSYADILLHAPVAVHVTREVL